MGERIVRLSALFYGLMILLALLWSFFRGIRLEFLGESAAEGVLYGLAAAVLTVSGGLVVYRLVPVMRRIASEVAPRVVDPANELQLVFVALLSGFGEEILFRGVVQQEFGLVVAAVVFGLVHVGPDRRYLVWTLWALFAGFLLGGLYELTGALLAPVTAHALHNGVTLILWKRSQRGAK
jgi:membrane protease YdiL (CAAX protease family)